MLTQLFNSSGFSLTQSVEVQGLKKGYTQGQMTYQTSFIDKFF